ncbi:MAG: response regulator [Odoribacter sp.]
MYNKENKIKRALLLSILLFCLFFAYSSLKYSDFEQISIENGLLYALFGLVVIFFILYYGIKRSKRQKQAQSEKEEVKSCPKEDVFVPTLPTALSQEEMQTIQDEEIIQMQNTIASETTDSKKKLLIVEDNQDIRTYLRILFSRMYEIVLAKNGQEGVDMAIREMPDVILCDVLMPIKNGFECCRELKKNFITSHIPIIMLTAKADDADIIIGTEAGADDYLLKPVNPEILKSKVRNQIKNRLKLKQIYMQQLMQQDVASATNDGAEVMDDHFIRSVVEIVEANIREADFNVAKLAEIMNMSPSTLYRKIKMSTNFTTIELVRGVRLKKAAILLKQQDYSVQEVAELVGYNDIPTFRKHFTEFFGKTPSNYAKKDEVDVVQ